MSSPSHAHAAHEVQGTLVAPVGVQFAAASVPTEVATCCECCDLCTSLLHSIKCLKLANSSLRLGAQMLLLAAVGPCASAHQMGASRPGQAVPALASLSDAVLGIDQTASELQNQVHALCTHIIKVPRRARTLNLACSKL